MGKAHKVDSWDEDVQVADAPVAAAKQVNDWGEDVQTAEPVKKKESTFQDIPQSLDLRTGLPVSLNGGENIPATPSSKYPSQLPSDKNPFRTISNIPLTDYDNAVKFLDTDIQRQSDMSLNSPVANGQQDKFSLQNAGGAPEQNTLQALPQAQAFADKKAITTNPEALKQYRVKRQAEINSRVSDLTEKDTTEADAYEAMGGGGVLSEYNDVMGIKKVTENTPAIDALKEYQKNFQESVQNTAKVIIPKKHLESKAPIDLQQIGKEYLETVGDPTIGDDEKALSGIDAEFKTGVAIKAPDGTILPAQNNQKDIDYTKQDIQYRLYKTGADVMTDYYSTASDKAYDEARPKVETLSVLYNKYDESTNQKDKNIYANQINNLLVDPTIKTYLDTVRQAADYQSKSEKSLDLFPQVKRQEIAQTLNDVYLNNVMYEMPGADVKDFNSATMFALKKIFQLNFGATASDEDIKKLAKQTGVSEDVVKSIADEETQGLFGNSPSRLRVSGLLQGVAKGTDDQLAQSLMGIRRIFNVDNVEAKNRLLQGKLDIYNTDGSEIKLNDALGNWNINPYSIVNTMGRGIGQTTVFAAPTLVTGGLAAEGSIAAKGIDAVTTLASGYAGSYESAYKDASRYTSDEKLRRAYANITAWENAAPELLMSPAEQIKMLSPKKIGGKAAFDAFVKDAAENGLEQTVKQKTLGTLGRFADVVVAENIEEQVTNITNNESREKMLGIKMTAADWMKQAIQTAVQTTITTVPLGIGAGINGGQDASGIRREAYFEAGNSPDATKDGLKQVLDRGEITQERYNERVQLVNTMQNIVASVNKTKKADGSSLSYDEKRDLAAEQFRIQNNEAKKTKGNLLTAQESQIENDNNEALSRQNEILFGKPKTEAEIKPLYKNDGKEIEKAEATKLIKEGDIATLEVHNDKDVAEALVKAGGVFGEKGNTTATGSEIIIPEAPKVKGTPEEISKPIELNIEDNGNIATAGQTKNNEAKKADAETEKIIPVQNADAGQNKSEQLVTKPASATLPEKNIDEPVGVQKNVEGNGVSSNGEGDFKTSDGFKELKPNRKDFKNGVEGDQPYANAMADYNEKLNSHLSNLKEGVITDSSGNTFNVREGANGAIIEDSAGNIVFKNGKFTVHKPISESFKFKSKDTNQQTPNTESKAKGDVVSEPLKESDADIEKRMAELEGKHNGIPSAFKNEADSKEYNDLEKEMEKRERSTVFDVPLENVNDAVDALLKKEKDKPNGFGAFIEKRDARETKEIADRYLNAKELTDRELKKDFKDALFGNPTTWYADGLKLRESMNEAAKRGIEINDLLKTVKNEFTKDGFDEATARKVIAGMLKPIFEGSQKVNEKQLPNAKAETKTKDISQITDAGVTILNEPTDQRGNSKIETGEVGKGTPTEGKYETKARKLADKISNADIPQWLINTDPTLGKQGISGDKLKQALAQAVINVGKLLDEGKSLADSIRKGADHIVDFYKQNLGLREGVKLKPDFENQLRNGFESYYNDNYADKSQKPEPNDESKEIDGYKLTTSDETEKFLSGKTLNDIFGEMPEGNQNYLVQKLTDMLQDGKNMIAIAQQKWGNDIMQYGRNLFSFIQGMSNDEILTNKKAVLLATFLGEIKEASLREPNRFNEIKQLENVVMAYYQNYMNLRGKEVVAGRLLRLYRDKYLGDVFADRILEEKEIKEKNSLLKAEEDAKKIDDIVAAKVKEALSENEKKQQDAAADKKSKTDAKKQSEKKNMSQKEAQQKADAKLKEIENNLGKEKDKGLIAKIQDLINKLNCS